MSEASEVVGEGTYGCVHSPPLNCKGENRPPSNKVTKLMRHHEAEKELKEYKTMSQVDPKENYYLGTPRSCKVDNNNYNKVSAEKCKKLKSLDRSIVDHLSEYTLLVMDNGGDNLEEFSKRAAKWTSSDARRKMEQFWIEAHRAFMGVKAFLDHRVIHHDLKPQNIVYNDKTGRINFIDFGLMKNKEEVVKEVVKSKYGFSLHHWSFPLECRYLNKANYDKYANLTNRRKHNYLTKVAKGFEKNDGADISDAIRFFLYYSTNKSDGVLNKEKLTKTLLKQFGETLLNIVTPGEVAYKAMVDKCLDTIDTYGLGLGLLSVINHTYELVDPKLAEDLCLLFLDMTSANVMARINISTAIERYEDILEKRGVLNRFNQHFNNRVLTDGPLIPDVVENKINEVSVKAELASPKEMKDMLMKDPEALDPPVTETSSTKRKVPGKSLGECPEGKERHPKTRRCVKKCKEGEARNERFECRKTQRKWRTRKAEKNMNE
jgi:serine/threonine protein kinase